MKVECKGQFCYAFIFFQFVFGEQSMGVCESSPVFIHSFIHSATAHPCETSTCNKMILRVVTNLLEAACSMYYSDVACFVIRLLGTGYPIRSAHSKALSASTVLYLVGCEV